MSGEQTPPPAPPPPPPVRTQRPWEVDDIQFDTPPPPSVTIKRKAVPPPPSPPKPVAPVKESSIGELDMASSFKQISDIKEAKEMMDLDLGQLAEQEALASVRSMMIDLRACMVSVPIIPMPTINTVRTQTPRPDLKNRATFKKALVASFILEPPKALQPSPQNETA